LGGCCGLPGANLSCPGPWSESDVDLLVDFPAGERELFPHSALPGYDCSRMLV
jgi:hypothetical protein